MFDERLGCFMQSITVVAGFVAKHFGIQYIMHLGMGALIIGLLVAVSPKETALARLKAMVAAAAVSP